MRKIRKYANRKMYDVKNKAYINNKQLLEIFKTEELQVLEVRKGEVVEATHATIVNALYAMNTPPSMEDLKALVTKYHIVEVKEPVNG